MATKFSAYFCHLPDRRKWQKNEIPPLEYHAICDSPEQLQQFILQFPAGSVFEVSLILE